MKTFPTEEWESATDYVQYNVIFGLPIQHCFFLSTLGYIAIARQPLLRNLISAQQILFTHTRQCHMCVGVWGASWWIMPVYEHSTNLFKKPEMSVRLTFITLTGIPHHLSVTESVTTNSGTQQEMKSAGGTAERAACCLHIKYPILCSQFRLRKKIHQSSGTHRLPSTSFVTLGSLMERRMQRITPSLTKHWGESHKMWQMECKIWATYGMTAGADDADRTQDALRTLEKQWLR